MKKKHDKLFAVTSGHVLYDALKKRYDDETIRIVATTLYDCANEEAKREANIQ